MSACPDCPRHGHPDVPKRSRCCVDDYERGDMGRERMHPSGLYMSEIGSGRPNRQQRRAADAKNRRR